MGRPELHITFQMLEGWTFVPSCATNTLKFWREIDAEQVVDCELYDNDDELEKDSSREQKIDAAEDD